MPIKTPDGFKCPYCNTVYNNEIRAVSCEQAHDLVYVAFKREDLYYLIQFLYSKDESLLTPSLMNTLRRYNKGFYV